MGCRVRKLPCGKCRNCVSSQTRNHFCACPLQVHRSIDHMELTTIQSTSNVTIHGAQRAGELEPTVRQACGRSSHAPESNMARPTSLPEPTALSTYRQAGSGAPVSNTAGPTTPLDAEEAIAPGAEVWQELVRMLVAREAAKLLHPARRSRV